jgi:hypothetical protein
MQSAAKEIGSTKEAVRDRAPGLSEEMADRIARALEKYRVTSG